MMCKNCGNKGHTFKNCKEPKISCGVILYRDNNGESELLMVQRKDSFCYIDFIRGKYNLNDIDNLKLFLSRMSSIECKKLKDHNFLYLWYDLWKKPIPTFINESKLSNEYNNSKKKFNKLKNGFYNNNVFYNLENILNTINVVYDSPEWEFPKGKRILNENNKKCATRELKEETNIKTNDFNIFKNIIPFSEIITGENNIKYKNIYYLGKCTNSMNIKIDITNKNQIYEINNVMFLNRENALSKIREYNTTKIQIINNIFNFINNDLNNYIIK